MKEMEEKDISRELATKIEIPKEIREAIYTKLFKNLIIAISIFIYFIFLNLGYMRLTSSVFESDLHVFAGILIVSTVILFEIAYRKNSDELALHGIELFILSVITLFLPYAYFHKDFITMTLYSFSAMYIAIYYVIKCMIIYTKEVKKYKNGLSDIKEILEGDEDESYLDEKSKRKFSSKEVKKEKGE